MNPLPCTEVGGWVGRAPGGPTPLTAPARPGKVRRKWAKGERPAAESQPQGREDEELNLGGEGTLGSWVDKAPGPYARRPRR